VSCGAFEAQCNAATMLRNAVRRKYGINALWLRSEVFVAEIDRILPTRLIRPTRPHLYVGVCMCACVCVYRSVGQCMCVCVYRCMSVNVCI
jgi:hypothetical protein